MATARFIGSDEVLEVRKIFCIGRNYTEHAKEMNASIPEAPIFFLKPTTAIIGNGGIILKPAISNDLHHEVEMTVLIGRGGKQIHRSEALDHVAGFCHERRPDSLGAATGCPRAQRSGAWAGRGPALYQLVQGAFAG